MRAYDYLFQIRKLNRNINNKIVELEQLKSLTGIKAITYDDDKVQTSGDQEGFAPIVIKIVEMEKEINQMIDELVDKKAEIVSKIEQISDPNIYNILQQYFIQEKSWFQISEETGFSYQWVHELKNRGLAKIQETLDSNL